jgi:hypothetical protein
MLKKLLLFLLCFTICSCTWVRLTKDGEAVTVKTEAEVSDCKRVAKTTASLRSKVMGVERDEDKIKLELETLARNAAVEYGGNVVVPITEIEEGAQSFAVYKCKN